MLEAESGLYAVKERGLRVLRASITEISSLIGKSPNEIDFRRIYGAGIVAIQKGGETVAIPGVEFGPGDILVLQVNKDSPLLEVPPTNFYSRLKSKEDGKTSRATSIVNMLTKSLSGRKTDNLQLANPRAQSQDWDNEQGKEISNAVEVVDGFDNAEKESNKEVLWKDLQVLFLDQEQGSTAREFLTAMEVAPKSSLATKSAVEIGLDKFPGVFLVSIDRPTTPRQHGDDSKQNKNLRFITWPSKHARSNNDVDDPSDAPSLSTMDGVFTAVLPDAPLQSGDVLWFAGSASSVGDLRKIPGIVSYESDEVKKMNEKVHDRRLVEAVIARRGPLVGKTVKEVKFRTKFGAAVLAVHRDGNRIHDHPGKVKLQAGDVLLLEAGPTFIKKGVENNRSFALLAEVEDSAPPRMTLLIPAVVLIITMLAVSFTGIASLLICALIASVLMVCIGILSEQEARDAISWDIYIAIASAFGIGNALVNSGLAEIIAGFLVDIGEGVGIGGEFTK